MLCLHLTQEYKYIFLMWRGGGKMRHIPAPAPVSAEHCPLCPPAFLKWHFPLICSSTSFQGIAFFTSAIMSVNVAAALQLGQVDPAIKSSICPNLRFQALRFFIKAASLSNSKVFLPLPFFERTAVIVKLQNGFPWKFFTAKGWKGQNCFVSNSLPWRCYSTLSIISKESSILNGKRCVDNPIIYIRTIKRAGNTTAAALLTSMIDETSKRAICSIKARQCQWKQ